MPAAPSSTIPPTPKRGYSDEVYGLPRRVPSGPGQMERSASDAQGCRAECRYMREDSGGHPHRRGGEDRMTSNDLPFGAVAVIEGRVVQAGRGVRVSTRGLGPYAGRRVKVLVMPED